MTRSRRDILKTGSLAGVSALMWSANSVAAAPSTRNGQGQADLAKGKYVNPVISGDRADPAIIKDGEDYYVTHSSFDYYPGIVIWHSRDLINWTPIGPALQKNLGSVYAMDIAKVGSRFFIYIPVYNPKPPKDGSPARTLRIYVIHAESMRGPWSDPVDMGIYTGVDPGHIVTEEGKRYLYLSDGQLYPISDDGLKVAGERTKAYEGWKYPAEWIDEGFSLEGPKLLRRNGWFYMFSAQGGTAGPPTSHMIVAARARSAEGPWENCPHNPIVRTRTADEPWWSRGHGTPIEGPDGRWWLVYHGYENGYRTLGRQMLLEPIEWTQDDWPKAMGGDLSKPLGGPLKGSATVRSTPHSGRFTPEMLGSSLAFYKPEGDYLKRATFEDGALLLEAQGSLPSSSSPLAMNVGDRDYELSVHITLSDGARAGLLLWYNDSLFCGVGRNETRQTLYKLGKAMLFGAKPGQPLGKTFDLKVVNEGQVGTFLSSPDGTTWTREFSCEVSGYNHNMAQGFLSLRPAFFVNGEGSARFSNLRYTANL